MEELDVLRERLTQERPAQWEDLPDIPLYMDQVISYLPRQLIHFAEGEHLTSAMVNNYIKSGLVPRAAGKRYDQSHIAYLTAVCALKRVLSVKDMGVLFQAGRNRNQEQAVLYQKFYSAMDTALNQTAQEIGEDLDENNLASLALELAMNSYANQLACRRVLELLEERAKED